MIPEHGAILADYLYRNGVIMERARREGRSLSHEERQIIIAARDMAAEKKISRWQMNSFEMDGERDKDAVLRPIKVRAVFAFYWDPCEDIPATADYYIKESNHPALPAHGNVGADQLLKAGIGIPWTPTYETWVKRGRPKYQGDRP